MVPYLQTNSMELLEHPLYTKKKIFIYIYMYTIDIKHIEKLNMNEYFKMYIVLQLNMTIFNHHLIFQLP